MLLKINVSFFKVFSEGFYVPLCYPLPAGRQVCVHLWLI